VAERENVAADMLDLINQVFCGEMVLMIKEMRESHLLTHIMNVHCAQGLHLQRFVLA
jgi:hypothetical protein